MGHEDQRNWYLLLDSSGAPLARGHLESPPDAPNLQVRIAMEQMEKVLEHEDLQLVGMDADGPSLLGRIIMNRRDIVVLEKIKALGAEVRQNLRMPVGFQSFIYPLSGAWRGRRGVVAHDLSCGGIAFYCGEPLERGERVEIVVPITAQPLLLRCEILRRRPSGRSTPLYAAKFVELCNDEERMVREGVFGIQLNRRALEK